MRLTAQDDYGLRCLSHLARAGAGGSVTIAEIADRESLSTAHVAKLMRRLRRAGLVTSTRGRKGGYRLSRRAEDVPLSRVVEALGERLYSRCVCERHSGLKDECVHTADCPIRALWSSLDRVIQEFLSLRTLSDLRASERAMRRRIQRDRREIPGGA